MRDPPKILLSESEKGEFNIIIVTELCHRGSLSHLLDSLPGQQPDPIEALRTAQWSLFRVGHLPSRLSPSFAFLEFIMPLFLE